MSGAEKFFTTVIGIIAGLIGGGIVFLWAALIALLNSRILTDMWQWFITGTFGIKALTMPQAFGLILLTGFLTQNVLNRGDLLTFMDEDKKTAKFYAGLFLMPIFTSLLMWGASYLIYTNYIR